MSIIKDILDLFKKMYFLEDSKGKIQTNKTYSAIYARSPTIQSEVPARPIHSERLLTLCMGKILKATYA